jgi:Uma2 family endonuclease
MASNLIERFTTEEYLAIERAAQYKSEYIDGEIVAMVGASEPHNLIVTNSVGELSVQLRGRAGSTRAICELMSEKVVYTLTLMLLLYAASQF